MSAYRVSTDANWPRKLDAAFRGSRSSIRPATRGMPSCTMGGSMLAWIFWRSPSQLLNLAARCKKYCEGISRSPRQRLRLRQHLGMKDLDRTIFRVFGYVIVVLHDDR